MLKIGRLILTGLLALSLAPTARADSAGGEVKLGRYITHTASAQRDPLTVSPTSFLNVHAGYMFLPKGAVDLGVDLTVPSWSISEAWVPRFDLNFLIGADVDGEDNAVSLTANLVKFFPNAIGSRNVYFGGGIGVFFADGTDFQGKLILGTPINDQFSVELNTHFVPGTVAWTILARFHL